MDRTVDPGILAIALGEHEPGILPTPEELATLIAQVEVSAIRAEFGVSEELLGTAWYLHGVTAAAEGTALYDPARRRHAFAVSAHILDLALDDPRNRLNEDGQEQADGGAGSRIALVVDDQASGLPADSQRAVRARRLSMAFGAQIGYRRCEQDPNAAAVFRKVADLLVTDESPASHAETLAVEAGVVFLGMQRRQLAATLRAWRRQFRRLQTVAQLPNLRGTLYGPAQGVVEAVYQLTTYLTRSNPAALEQAEAHLRDVVSGGAGHGDRSAQWVAAHLLELLDELAAGSLQKLLPQGTPPALAQAFALSDPPVLTLWPPQRELLQHADPLDLDKKRLLISVPTSAGKTLMAQLVICAQLTAEAGRVLYVSPLRSLGREMRQALCSRLRVLGRKLGDDQPDFPAIGVGPDAGDVEVLTPERLMHALRQDAQAALQDVGLIVVDEAHHMAHPDRGFLLEGLLAFCQAHPNPPRLTLLSAAVGNHGTLASWLDPTQPPEQVVFTSRWRGPRRLHGLLTPRPLRSELIRTQRPPRKRQVRSTEASVPMALQISVRPTSAMRPSTMSTPALGTRVYAERYPGDTTEIVNRKGLHSIRNYELFAAGAAIISRSGSVLVVCPSRVATRNTARAVATHLPEHPPAAPLAEFLADTLGGDHPIVKCVRHGVAYHHAQLPAEVLHAVEDALRAEQLKVICCTSTLTDGVNLPVRSVIINTDVEDDQSRTSSGQPQMGPAQLLNAVGRAGRAGRESEGWILLTRHRQPLESDFSLMEPSEDRLHVTTVLGTEEALASLANAEELIAETVDNLYRIAENQAADFASYVWFTLDALARIPSLTAIPPLAAVENLLAMRQLSPELRDRWMAFARTVEQQYEATDPSARRRWTTPGTSIGSARALDGLAEGLTRILLQDPAATTPAYDGIWGDMLAGVFPDEWALQRTLDFFAENSVYALLLALPEADGSWVFTEKPSSSSARVSVDVSTAVCGWISGEPIPQLATDWLPSDINREWALEQTVSNISSTFEHYLAWTIGALVNLINLRLEEARAELRLPASVGWHVRHGVDTAQALALLNAGVTSRRLAHNVGRTAAAQGIDSEGLRRWLTGLHLDGWRNHFSATRYEANDLLEYVRTRRSSMVGALLDDGRVSLEVHRTGSNGTEAIPVSLRFADGPQPAALTVIGDHQRLARVPADIHLDVLSVIDSGIDYEATLAGDRLTLRLPTSR
ncbi:DEAD/DEAH box helicase [Streptomyces griseoincarnatus]